MKHTSKGSRFPTKNVTRVVHCVFFLLLSINRCRLRTAKMCFELDDRSAPVALEVVLCAQILLDCSLLVVHGECVLNIFATCCVVHIASKGTGKCHDNSPLVAKLEMMVHNPGKNEVLCYRKALLTEDKYGKQWEGMSGLKYCHALYA